jgi:glycine/D-amino acid oxidase-like deaminating enzyme
MTSAAYDVVIVGAGIVGAACAAECSRAGLRVGVIEASIIGGGATAAGMGHLVVMDDSEAQFALTRYSQILWSELAEDLPRDIEYEACGTIWVAADDEEMEEVRRKQNFYETRGMLVEVLDAHALAEAEPNLRQGLVGGLRVPADSVIYPPCAARSSRRA